MVGKRARACLGLVLLGAAGCAGFSTPKQRVTFDVRHRPLIASDAERAEAYREERDYVRERRRANGGVPESAPLTGIALSGGGIRSSTFSLGVLQALERRGVLGKLDYMSAISGGGYTAVWLQAHLGNRKPGDDRYLEIDQYGYAVGAHSPAELLSNSGEHVEAVRLRSGFLRGSGFWEGPKIIGGWLMRYPPYVVMDLALHLKGHYNGHSSNSFYKERIEATYFHGTPSPGERPPRQPKEKTAITDINADPGQTPYLVLGANLVNGDRRGKSSMFEFTRDFVGADALGYVPPQAFDRSVQSAQYEEGELRHVTVAVPLRAAPDPQANSRPPERDFRLSRAAAVSGAAFDPDGFLASFLCTSRRDRLCSVLRALGSYVLLPFNLNLGYETDNYARGRDHWWQVASDYLRMVTLERLPIFLTARSRWIKLTDGGHYDNTGIFSLLRRGTRCIVAIDGTADPEPTFGDLLHAGELARDELRLRFEPALPPTALEAGAPAPGAHEIAVLDEAGREQARILYLKPNVAPHAEHLRDRTDPDVVKIVRYRDNGPRSWAVHPTALLHGDWRGFAKRERSYPHTSTFFQWFDAEQFEAYRLLGYRMASFYLPDSHQAGEPLHCHFAEPPSQSEPAQQGVDRLLHGGEPAAER